VKLGCSDWAPLTAELAIELEVSALKIFPFSNAAPSWLPIAPAIVLKPMVANGSSVNSLANMRPNVEPSCAPI